VGPNVRAAERLELAVPAQIRTKRGNTIEAITREISRNGIGLLHRGAINMEEVFVKMASETREFYYRVQIEWCMPCDNGMFLSGGRFLPVPDEKSNSGLRKSLEISPECGRKFPFAVTLQGHYPPTATFDGSFQT
jgi:hypothetical protein